MFEDPDGFIKAIYQAARSTVPAIAIARGL